MSFAFSCLKMQLHSMSYYCTPVSLCLTQAAPPSHKETDGPLPDHAVRQLAVSLLTLITIYMHDPKMKINVLLVKK